MLVKWVVGGAVVGVIAAVMTKTSIGSGALFEAVVGVVIRKWIARNLWM